MMKTGRAARFSKAGLILVLAGAGIALRHAAIYSFVLGRLSVERQFEVVQAQLFYEGLPLLLGFSLVLVGTFLLTYGRAGLIAGPAPLASRLLAFAPPGKLMLGALLFFLPWIDVQCRYRMHDGSSGAETIATQTGVQAAMGATTNRMDRNPFEPEKEYKPFAQEPAAAPLVAAALAATTLGALGGFVLRRRKSRLRAVAVGSVAGLLLLGAQHAYGYPIAVPVAQQNVGLAKDPEYTRPESRLAGPPQLRIRYTWWYHAVLALQVAALVAAGADGRFNRRRMLEDHAGSLADAALDQDRL